MRSVGCNRLAPFLYPVDRGRGGSAKPRRSGGRPARGVVNSGRVHRLPCYDPTSITALIRPDFSCAQRARSRGVSPSVVRWVTSFASGTAPLRIEAATWSKSARKRVAAADQRHLALVEFGIGEGDVVLDDTDEDQCSAMRDMGEGRLHRLGVAGCVEDHVEAFAAGRLPHQIGRRRLRSRRASRSRVRFRRKPSLSVLMSSRRHVEPGDARKQRGAKPDRAGADDQRSCAGLRPVSVAPHARRWPGIRRRRHPPATGRWPDRDFAPAPGSVRTWRRRGGRRAPRS